jgi:hypothetical protein
LETQILGTSHELDDFALWEQEITEEGQAAESLGGFALDLSGIDFDALVADINTIDVDGVILQEFTNSLYYENDEDKSQRRTISDVVKQAEFFLALPQIQMAMGQLDILARQFAHLCNMADGHGGFSVSSLAGASSSFYERGNHSKDDGHGHEDSGHEDKLQHDTSCAAGKGGKCSCKK